MKKCLSHDYFDLYEGRYVQTEHNIAKHREREREREREIPVLNTGVLFFCFLFFLCLFVFKLLLFRTRCK